MALYLDVGPDDVLVMDGEAAITVERKTGARTRLRITGPGKADLRKNERHLYDERPREPPDDSR